MAFCYLIPFAFLWFVMNLTHSRPGAWFLTSLILVALFFLLFSFSPLMIRDVVTKMGFRFWPVPGALTHFYVAIFCGMVIASYWILLRGLRLSSGMQKWQIRWISWALLPGWIGGAMNWCLWYDIPVPPVGHFFVGMGFLVLSYAIIRSRLFDAEALADLIQETKLSAIGLMASSINHEVRNPLFVIKGLAETYLETIADKDPLMGSDPSKIRAKEYFEKTLRQSERALEIMRNFSNFAKRETGKTMAQEPLRLKALIENIRPLVQGELALDKIDLNVSIHDSIMVLGDRFSLEEVFLNLVVNACQAMPSGGRIEIEARPRKNEVDITVKDNGPGMSRYQLQRIFEPFYTTKKGGVGLGLYVTKQLVERNGGHILVYSDPDDTGTSFTVVLPRSS